MRSLSGHTDVILAVAASESTIATASKDETVRIWDYSDNVTVCRGHVDPVSAVCFIGENVASGGRDRTLKVWSRQGEALATVVAHDKDVNCVTSKNQLLATASQDKTAKVWRFTNGLEAVLTLKGHKRGVWQVAFAEKKRVLATCSGDKTIKIWHGGTGENLATLDGHETAVLCIKFLVDETLMSGSADGRCKLWTLATSKCECTLDAHDEARCWDIAAVNGHIVTVGADSQIRYWTDATAKDKEELETKRLDEARKEQALRRALQEKNWKVALDEAFDLDRPLTAWSVFQQADNLHAIVADWSRQRAIRCLAFITEWNTDATKAYVAHGVLQALILKFGPGLLAGHAAIAAYTKRHLRRIDRLHQSTFALDLALSSSNALPPQSLPRLLPTIFPDGDDDNVILDDDDDDDELPPVVVASPPQNLVVVAPTVPEEDDPSSKNTDHPPPRSSEEDPPKKKKKKKPSSKSV